MKRYTYNEHCSDSLWRVIGDCLVMTVSDRDVAEIHLKDENVDEIACLYLLVNNEAETVYIGETENAKSRISQHRKGGPPVRGGAHAFDKVAVIWDGRPVQTTKFSDSTVRKSLEAELIRAFRGFGKYRPVNASGSGSRPNLQQKETISRFREEMFFILHKFGYLEQVPEEARQSRALTDEETMALLGSSGFAGDKKGRWVKCPDGRTVYSVPASEKPSGWQITVRDDLMRMFEERDPNLYVLLQRTRPYLFPSGFLGPLVLRNRGKNTVDIYVDDRKSFLKCGRQNGIDVSEYALDWPPA